MNAGRGSLGTFLVAMSTAGALSAQEPPPMSAAEPVRGRREPLVRSPLQAMVDAAPAGARLVVPAGTYEGTLVIDKPLVLVGQGRPRLVGGTVDSVMIIRGDDVRVEGFDIDGRGTGDLGLDSSGIHLSGRRAVVRDCRIDQTLFGIYLLEAHGAEIEGCTITGIRGRDAGEKGSGLHVYATEDFRLVGNTVVDVRDGIYIQSSPRGSIVGNVVRDIRYGIHYMNSDENTFEDNLFENGAAGAALMFSRRLTFRRNRFLRNRGYASVGLLFQSCDDVLAEDNLVADNARGIFLEGSYRNTFRRNVVAASDAALVIFGSSGENVFEGNSFVANLTPLQLVGRRTDTRFDGNYWSGNDEPDLDGDGRSDGPYRLSNVFDHLRGNLTTADLLASAPAALALGAAERAFPVLEQVDAVDHAPLAHPPALPHVPRPGGDTRGVDAVALSTSLAAVAFGVAVLSVGRPRRKARAS